MKHISVVIVLFCLAAASSFAAVPDPVADYLQRSDKVTYRPSFPAYYLDDHIYRFDIDLNQDGKKEVLISSSQDKDGKQGNVFYVYRQVGSDFERAGEIHLNPDGFYLGKISEIDGYGIVKFSPAGGGEGAYTAYIFDGSRIVERNLGSIERNRTTFELEGRGIEIAAKYSRFVSDAIRGRVEQLRTTQGFQSPEPSAFISNVKVIRSEELAGKYGITVEAKTFQQALQEGPTAPALAQKSAASATTPIVESTQPSNSNPLSTPAGESVPAQPQPPPSSSNRSPWVIGTILVLAVIGGGLLTSLRK